MVSAVWTIVTVPVEANVSVPEVKTSPASVPTLIDVPPSAAFPMTTRLIPAVSVMAPVEVSETLAAEFVPTRFVSAVCEIATVPTDVNVSVPDVKLSPAPVPTVMAVPSKVAFPATARLIPGVSVIAPLEVRTRLAALLVPFRFVSVACVIVTAPADTNVSEPEAKKSPAPVPTVMEAPLRAASPVTTRLMPATSVMAPLDFKDSVPAELLPLRLVPAVCVMTTVPTDANVNVPEVKTSPAPVPTVIAVPLRAASPATIKLIPGVSVIAPLEVRARLAAVMSADRREGTVWVSGRSPEH